MCLIMSTESEPRVVGPDGHTTVEEYGPGRAINRRAMVLSNQDVVRSYFKTNDAPFDALLSAETGRR